MRLLKLFLVGLSVAVLPLIIPGCMVGNKGESFEFGPGDKLGPGRNAEVLQSNLELVAGYEKKIPVGFEILAVGNAPSQCGYPPFRYRLSRLDSGFEVRVRVRLEFESSVTDSRAKELVAKANACVPQIKSVWKRNKIDLNLEFDTSSAKLWNNPDYTVNGVDGSGRANMATYYFDKDPSEFCLTTLHEVGHLLGFADEYYEAGTCRDEEHASKWENPWSVMNKHFYGWLRIEFFSNHIRALFDQANSAQMVLTSLRDIPVPSELLTPYKVYRYQAGKLLKFDATLFPTTEHCYLTASAEFPKNGKPRLPPFGGLNLPAKTKFVLTQQKSKLPDTEFGHDFLGFYEEADGRQTTIKLDCRSSKAFEPWMIPSTIDKEDFEMSYKPER